ncbi:unnamed protein product [Phaedon cochleariae]|uniref:Uncharacterized protein n=1 Tax=Phaedon cochleariae TaxID=80249 RepID=A0A9N9X1R0_PHACE|nr:unnamed protein product [Phaedon cochleariae]
MAAIHIIQSSLSNKSSDKNSKIQSIPCKILADCDANVKQYFDDCTTAKEDGSLTASFRGYPLEGQKVNLPEGYKVIVLNENVKPETESDERKFYVVNQFSDIFSWNWDRKPSKNDAIIQALQWIDVAEAVSRSCNAWFSNISKFFCFSYTVLLKLLREIKLRMEK